MAREFAQIRLSIWMDDDFTALTAEQQLVYLMLSSQPTINLAGVLDYLPGRLARLSGGLTASKVGKIITELENHNFVFLDEDTDEILVRSLIRTSGAWKTPNSAQAIALNAQQVMSRKLKSVLLAELRRVVQEAIEANQWEKSRTLLATGAATLERDGINPWVKGCPNPSPKGSPGEGEGEGDGTRGDGERDGAIAPRGAIVSEQFEQWWSHWRKKKARAKAFDSFKIAITKIPLDDLITATDAYFAWIDRNNIADQHILMPTTYLNQERWDDELTDHQQQHRPDRAVSSTRGLVQAHQDLFGA